MNTAMFPIKRTRQNKAHCTNAGGQIEMEKLSVGCFEELLIALGERQNKGKNIFLLFCGDVDEATGKSWCPDCVKGL